jgi:hypothetical protein
LPQPAAGPHDWLRCHGKTLVGVHAQALHYQALPAHSYLMHMLRHMALMVVVSQLLQQHWQLAWPPVLQQHWQLAWPPVLQQLQAVYRLSQQQYLQCLLLLLLLQALAGSRQEPAGPCLPRQHLCLGGCRHSWHHL